MFNIGFTELIAIGVIALIFIGPQQLPEIAKIVGKLMGEFRKASQDLAGGLLDVKRNMNTSIHKMGEVETPKKEVSPPEAIDDLTVTKQPDQVSDDEPKS
jgi:Tat protein translocase TatB subunit